MGMSALLHADLRSGAHLFRVVAAAPGSTWLRPADGELATSIRDTFALLEPHLRLGERSLFIGEIDEHGTPSIVTGRTLAPGAPWPDATIVEAVAPVLAFRIGLPARATLGDATTFACDSKFVRTARVAPAGPLLGVKTRWIEGGPLLESAVQARIDGATLLTLSLSTSLHDADDLRPPTFVVEGASLAEWRAASRQVADALHAALATAGFRRHGR
jgi:hypothetical protein